MSFPIHDEQTAPAAARPYLAGSRKQMGFIPAPMARLAEAPQVLEVFFGLLKQFDATSLTLPEREAVVLTVATHNGCEWCVAHHRQLAQHAGIAPEDVAALIAQRAPAASRLARVQAFTQELLAERGAASDEALAAWLADGFTHRQAMEVVLGIATYTLSTYCNRLTRAPLDIPA